MITTEQTHLQRLIYVTSNYRCLRGLTMVPIGFMCVLFPILGHFSVKHGTLAMAGLLISFALTAVGTRQLYTFYERHYGTAKSAASHWSEWISFLVLFAIYFACAAMDGRTPKFSLQALWVAAIFWGISASAPGYRWYYLILTVCFVALVPHWSELGEGWQGAVIGSAFAAGGLMDHLLLMRLLPSSAEGDLSLNVAQ